MRNKVTADCTEQGFPMTNRINRRIMLALILAIAWLSRTAIAGPLDLAVDGTHIDVAASFPLIEGKKTPAADEPLLMSMLGIAKVQRTWSIDRQQVDGKAPLVQFVIALTKSTAVGSIHMSGTFR